MEFLKLWEEGRPFLFHAAGFPIIVPFFLNLQLLLYSFWTAAVIDISYHSKLPKLPHPYVLSRIQQD